MAILGNERKCYIGAASGNTWTWLTGEQNNSFTVNANQVETSDKSNAWQSFIYGIKGATADVTVFTDNNDSEQIKVIKAIHKGEMVKVFIGKLTGTSTQGPSEGDAFEALVASVSDTNDNGAVSSRSISLVANGAVTHYPTFGSGDIA